MNTCAHNFEPYVGDPDVARLKAVLKGETVDRVPNIEVLIEDQHVSRILGYQAGNTLATAGAPAKGADDVDSGARPMYPGDYIKLNTIIGQDALIIEAFWTPFKKYGPEGQILPLVDRSVKTRANWEQVIHPDVSDVLDKIQYVVEYKEAIAQADSRQGVILAGCCLFQTAYEYLVGLNDFMIMCYEEPDLVEEILDASADYWAELVRAAVDEGIDIFFFADDFAWKNGLFIPPDLFKQLWLPRAKRILKPALEGGIPIYFHSDGKIDDAVEWLIDIGVDGITPLDPSGVDYRDYKKRFGDRLTLFGNIDIEWPLAHGTPTDVERDVIEHMEALKPGGRYVAASSHSITNFVPWDNFVAMVNAIHKHGLY